MSFLHPSYSGVDEVICGTFLQGFYDKGRRGDSGPFYNTTFFLFLPILEKRLCLLLRYCKGLNKIK